MTTNRRDFLTGAVLAAGGAAMAGCTSGRCCGAGTCGPAGAPMLGFCAPKLDRVRVGVVGVGERGWRAAERLSGVPGVDVAAICDNVPEKIVRTRELLAKKGAKPPREFGGDEGWKALCDWDGVDVVYNTTPWYMHAKVGLYAM